jgi:DNA replication licensing factor MCM7
MKLQVHRDIYVPDYDGEIKRCTDFIRTFQDPTLRDDQLDPIHGNLKYMSMIQAVVNKHSSVIAIELDDLYEFFQQARERGFVERIKQNTQRYVKLFSNVIDSNLPLPSVQFNDEDLTSFDIVM